LTTDRALLKRAIAERGAAALELSECEAALASADTLLRATVESDSAMLATLSAAAEERTAAAVARGEVPTENFDDLVKARAIHAERHDHMASVIRKRTLDRDNAQLAWRRAHRRVEELGIAIIVARAHRQAAKVAGLYQILLGEADLLSAMANIWAFGGPIRLPPAVVRVKQAIDQIDFRFDPGLYSGATSEKGESKAAWSDRLKRWQDELIRDADATLDD
jgi:hypothetical protein